MSLPLWRVRFACWTCHSQERASLETQVATMTQRQKESDINEEHLNEKLKAITEKCQAVLVHNSKLQEQVSGRHCLCARLSSYVLAPLFHDVYEKNRRSTRARPKKRHQVPLLLQKMLAPRYRRPDRMPLLLRG